ncbi:MAG: hypothetical protein ABW321_10250, partial [Polyangiales bacterium]
MTPIFLAWLLSLTGAGLFFAAGEVWSRQRKERRDTQEESTIGAELAATRAHMVEQERAKQELRAHESQLTQELTHRRSAFDQLKGELSTTQQRTESLERELAAARAELQKSRERMSAPPRKPDSASPDKIAADKAAVEKAAAEKVAAAEKAAAADKAAADRAAKAERAASDKAIEAEREVQRIKRELDRATERLQEADAERTRLADQIARLDTEGQAAALQQELSLTRETLNARDAQLEQLREESVRLKAVEADLERSKRELGELAEQTRLLRAEAYASRRPPAKRPERPATISTRGDALQLIVDDETEHGGARSAVIADELGLVVAASGVVGEYGDALAAFGAYLADVGTRTRDVLPLHEVRQVVVRDDHDTTLTVRPLATEDPGLALVT